MPCRDYSDSSSSSVAYREAKVKVDKLTRLLCEACGIIADNGGISLASNELNIWWEKHQKEDERRLADEKKARDRKLKKQKALAKLTLEDRKLLNL